MNLTQPTPIEPAAGPFLSGAGSRPRRLFARLGRWLFAPPYLPGPLAACAFLLILADALLILMQQQAGYWADHRIIMVYGMNWLFEAGPWAVLGFMLAYGLLVTLALLVLNRSAAWVAWLGVCLYHIGQANQYIFCGLRPFFYFNDRQFCQPVRTAHLAYMALAWGLIFAGSLVLMRQRPEGEAQEEAAAPAPRRLPRILLAGTALLVAWLALTVVGFTRAASAPRATWQKVESAHVPAPRTSVALAYDTRRARAVMFGGSNRWNKEGEWIGLGDTWEWDGSDWTEMRPAISPPPRLDTAMAYDEKRGVVVLFGGQSQGFSLNDTWEWDGQTWTQHSPASAPEARCCFQMVYDPQVEAVVLFAGFTGKRNPPAYDNVFYKDVWQWDGADWHKMDFAEDTAMLTYAMTYAARLGDPLLFDTSGAWVMQGGQLHSLDLPSALAPAGRGDAGLAYHPLRESVLLYGGAADEEKLDDTWEFDGSAWKMVYTVDEPGKRSGHEMFFDAARGRLLLFGGFDGKTTFNDTWELVLP